MCLFRKRKPKLQSIPSFPKPPPVPHWMWQHAQRTLREKGAIILEDRSIFQATTGQYIVSTPTQFHQSEWSQERALNWFFYNDPSGPRI